MATLTFELIQPFWLCAPQTNEYASVVPLTYLLCCEGPLPSLCAAQLGQIAKARQKCDFKNREIDGSYLCLQ